MKKLFIFLSVCCSLQANAQPYSISFSGTGLSTVKVQNLTSGVVVDVPAGDVLILSTPTGIDEVNNLKSSGLKVYPNPMTDKSTLEILPPVAGDAIISIYDISGKVITQYKGSLENYTQEFILSGVKNGLHIVNVQGNGYQFSEKLLCTGKSDGTAVIDRVSNNTQKVAGGKSIRVDSKGAQGSVDMAYNSGERLKYTAVSGNNSTVMTDIPASDKTVDFTFTECKDGDDNYYPVVQIGTQLWMAENLKTTTYRNGVSIGTTSPYNKDISGETDPTYQWAYDGNESNIATYGRLYTWYAIMDSRNVCPADWHVPSDLEWSILSAYLSGDALAGGKLKETVTTHWISPNTGASNESGYTAVPSGRRTATGTFVDLRGFTIFWSAKEIIPGSQLYRILYYNNSGFYYGWGVDNCGYAVRCVRD